MKTNRKCINPEMNRKKALSAQCGFSLIELIIVIAIMAVLIGLIAPNFVKYADQNRRKACRHNRESILNVYARCVYNGSLDTAKVNGDGAPADLVMVVNNPGDCPSDSFMQSSLADIEKYYKSDNNHKKENYQISVISGGAAATPDPSAAPAAPGSGSGGRKVFVIHCDKCEDDVMLDIADWSAEEMTESSEELETKEWPAPTPFDEGEEVTPTPEPTLPAYGIDDGYFPYQNSQRWKDHGANTRGEIVIHTPSGIQQSLSGSKYVMVGPKAEGGSDLNIQFNVAISPEYYRTVNPQFIIILSGRELKESDGYKDFDTNGNHQNQDYIFFNDVSYGDIVSVEGHQYVNWKPENNSMVTGNNGERFYAAKFNIRQAREGKFNIDNGWYRVDP